MIEVHLLSSGFKHLNVWRIARSSYHLMPFFQYKNSLAIWFYWSRSSSKPRLLNISSPSDTERRKEKSNEVKIKKKMKKGSTPTRIEGFVIVITYRTILPTKFTFNKNKVYQNEYVVIVVLYLSKWTAN